MYCVGLCGWISYPQMVYNTNRKKRSYCIHPLPCNFSDSIQFSESVSNLGIFKYWKLLVKSTSWTVALEDQPHVLARLACSIVLPTGIWNQFGEPRICGMDWSRRFGGSWVTLRIKSDCFFKVLVISCLVIHEFGIVWFSDVSLDSTSATLKWSQKHP